MASTRQPDLTEDQLQLIAKALADPRRYEILKQMGNAEGRAQSCASMRSCFDICAATLSHHMKELETAGLIRSEKEGKFVHYKLQAPVLRAYLDRLKSDLIQFAAKHIDIVILSNAKDLLPDLAKFSIDV